MIEFQYFKSQITNNFQIPHQQNGFLKFQTFEFGACFLGFIWNLIFGVWNLPSGDWHSLQSEHFTLSYKGEDEKFASEILHHGEEILLSISIHLGKIPSEIEKIQIFLTSRQEDFDRLTRNGVPDWGMGCALPEERTIILKSPRLTGNPPKTENLRSLIAHEISHILLHQSPFHEGGMRIPRWFDEGIAMFESKELRMGETMTLAFSVFTNSLLPLSTLEIYFPSEEKKAHLAYLQSFSTISYILEVYGEEGLRELLKNLTESGDFEEAIRKGLGITPEGFEKEWLTYLKSHYNFLYLLSDSHLLWGFLSLLFISVFVIKTIQIRKRKREQEEDLPIGSN